MRAKQELMAASRDRLFGPREDRSRSHIWFEEQSRAAEVHRGSRCYGLSNMWERPYNREAPPASMKVIGGTLDDVQRAVKDVLKVRLHIIPG